MKNATATLSGLLTSASGTRERVTYELVKEGGAWKIGNIDVEGDSGAIYRASGSAFDDPTVRKVADGTPEAPKPPPTPPTFTIDSVAIGADGKAFVTITVTDPTSTPPSAPFYLLLVPSDRGYLVDDILLPLVATIGEGG